MRKGKEGETEEPKEKERKKNKRGKNQKTGKNNKDNCSKSGAKRQRKRVTERDRSDLKNKCRTQHTHVCKGRVGHRR